MRMLTGLVSAVQSLLGVWAEEVDQESRVIQRERKFNAATLARTFILGFLEKPRATETDLAQTAALCGVRVTPQAVTRRFTPALVEFLERLLQKSMQCMLARQEAMGNLLDRFPAVQVMDSTTISLPPEYRERFPGCGGSHGGGQAAMKLQVMWDLKSGALSHMVIEAGRDCDYKTPLQSVPLLPKSLRICDLGYFSLNVLERYSAQDVYWLSRLQFKTSVFSTDGSPLCLMAWLAQQQGPVVDCSILLGSKHKLPCRLIAWRLPEEVANRRRQKLIAETLSKRGCQPTAERLAWCDWTILVTNVPQDVLSPTECAVLYGARWQIELLFKRWKSHGLIAELSGANTVVQMVRLWSRLLAVLLQHWLMLGTAWGDTNLSLTKVCRTIRRYTTLITLTIDNPEQFTKELEKLADMMRHTNRRSKRKRPSTFELLEAPWRLEYSLS